MYKNIAQRGHQTQRVLMKKLSNFDHDGLSFVDLSSLSIKDEWSQFEVQPRSALNSSRRHHPSTTTAASTARRKYHVSANNEAVGGIVPVPPGSKKLTQDFLPEDNMLNASDASGYGPILGVSDSRNEVSKKRRKNLQDELNTSEAQVGHLIDRIKSKYLNDTYDNSVEPLSTSMQIKSPHTLHKSETRSASRKHSALKSRRTGVPSLQLGRIQRYRSTTDRSGKRKDGNNSNHSSTKRLQKVFDNAGSNPSSAKRGVKGFNQTLGRNRTPSSTKYKKPHSTKATAKKFVFDDGNTSSTTTTPKVRRNNFFENSNMSMNSNLSTSSPKNGSALTSAKNTIIHHGSQDGVEIPMTPAQALKLSISKLTPYEQGEILDYNKIYFMGVNAEKVQAMPNAPNNHGYDDERGDYNLATSDHIAYRYEVLDVLGKGSFGQVVRCFDYKTNQYVALKIIRNKRRFHCQAVIEVRLLEHLKEKDRDDTYNVVHLKDFFVFRRHLCITFEMLSINLYEFIKNNNFQGVSLGLIRRFAIQILHGLKFLRKQRIIHCDLKPENILLKSQHKSAIKIIDFGSSCFSDEKIYTYIQSRFYRAPEIILGISYTEAIDMWSFGCILAELFTGVPMFPGENEGDQLACIMEVRGMPPTHILEISSRHELFFDEDLVPKPSTNSRNKVRVPCTKNLAEVLGTDDPLFIDFLENCLDWDITERFTPEEALLHPWVLEGITQKEANSRKPTALTSNTTLNGSNSGIKEFFKKSVSSYKVPAKKLKRPTPKNSKNPHSFTFEKSNRFPSLNETRKPKSRK